MTLAEFLEPVDVYMLAMWGRRCPECEDEWADDCVLCKAWKARDYLFEVDDEDWDENAEEIWQKAHAALRREYE